MKHNASSLYDLSNKYYHNPRSIGAAAGHFQLSLSPYQTDVRMLTNRFVSSIILCKSTNIILTFPP